MRATWKPYEKHGELTERGDIPDSAYAFPRERKEPLTDASHVRNAVARFDQVEGVSDAERELAFANIEKAAKHYGVDLSETSWRELGRKPSTGRTAGDRKKSGAESRGHTQTARYRVLHEEEDHCEEDDREENGAQEALARTGPPAHEDCDV